MWQRITDPEVAERLDRIDVPFNRYGLDPFGISRDHLGGFYSMLGFFYRRYFRCLSFGIEHIPDSGPVMLVGNHSGGLPVDGGMVIASLFFDKEPPRHTHGMVEKFAQHWPVVSPIFSRVGQLTGLPEHLLDRFPHQPSGGQKARVGIARAIAPNPDFLILDEPTAALDVSIQAVVLNLLADLRAQLGMSYLFVSHDLTVVRLLCDHVIVMKGGEIVEAGPVEQVMDNPTNPYTRELLSAAPQAPTAPSEEPVKHLHAV